MVTRGADWTRRGVLAALNPTAPPLGHEHDGQRNDAYRRHTHTRPLGLGLNRLYHA